VVGIGHDRADLVAVPRQAKDPDVVGAEHDPIPAVGIASATAAMSSP
jgi:hypothetical protein